jgi:hypothetical protein
MHVLWPLSVICDYQDLLLSRKSIVLYAFSRSWGETLEMALHLQVPDEEDLLKRRIKAEQRKQQAAVALEIKAASASAATAAAVAGKSSHSVAAAGLGELQPITVVVR